jgi:hypothetical protein
MIQKHQMNSTPVMPSIKGQESAKGYQTDVIDTVVQENIALIHMYITIDTDLKLHMVQKVFFSLNPVSVQRS